MISDARFGPDKTEILAFGLISSNNISLKDLKVFLSKPFEAIKKEVELFKLCLFFLKKLLIDDEGIEIIIYPSFKTSL